MREYSKSNSENKCEILCKEEKKRIDELERELTVIKSELDEIREIHDENKDRFDSLDKKIDILDRNLIETIDNKIDKHESRSNEKIDELFERFAAEREDRLLSNKDIEIDLINTINKISQLDGLLEEKVKKDKDRKLMLFYPIIVAIVTVIASTITRLF